MAATESTDNLHVRLLHTLRKCGYTVTVKGCELCIEGSPWKSSCKNVRAALTEIDKQAIYNLLVIDLSLSIPFRIARYIGVALTYPEADTVIRIAKKSGIVLYKTELDTAAYLWTKK